jgi:hypothetical protein
MPACPRRLRRLWHRRRHAAADAAGGGTSSGAGRHSVRERDIACGTAGLAPAHPGGKVIPRAPRPHTASTSADCSANETLCGAVAVAAGDGASAAARRCAGAGAVADGAVAMAAWRRRRRLQAARGAGAVAKLVGTTEPHSASKCVPALDGKKTVHVP